MTSPRMQIPDGHYSTTVRVCAATCHILSPRPPNSSGRSLTGLLSNDKVPSAVYLVKLAEERLEISALPGSLPPNIEPTLGRIMKSKTRVKKPLNDPELYGSDLRYRRIFESAPDGILILDSRTGSILDANPMVTWFLGYSRAELLGFHLAANVVFSH